MATNKQNGGGGQLLPGNRPSSPKSPQKWPLCWVIFAFSAFVRLRPPRPPRLPSTQQPPLSTGQGHSISSSSFLHFPPIPPFLYVLSAPLLPQNAQIYCLPPSLRCPRGDLWLCHRRHRPLPLIPHKLKNVYCFGRD
jgi:hypothetical protein